MRACCIYRSLLLLVSLVSHNLVSAVKRRSLRVNRKAQASCEDEENLHCLVREISGITPPTDGSDTHHHKTKLTCEVICLPDNPSTGKCHTQPLYDFNGSFVESFFEGMEERINTGTMELTVPPSAITNNSTIFIESPSDIILGCIDRRELRVESQSDHRALVTGIKKVLIIKLTDSSETNSSRKVTYSDWALLQDVFYDENNLAGVYDRCSGGQLTFQPSSDRGGVHTIYKSSSSYCGKHWLEVYGELQLNLASYWDSDHFMVIMPDCIDWEDAAGWGQTPGTVTWLPNDYFSYPIVQVHEMGHNFGHRHSGKGVLQYADDTGFMGNKGSWSDVGTKMCFNAAKIWYFGWFANKHQTVTVSNGGFTCDLVGVGEASMATVWTDRIVVKVNSEKANKADLFILFNSARNANSEVPGSADMIVITSQPSATDESAWVASLAAYESHTIQYWSLYNQDLVIKNCGMTGNTPNRAALVVALKDAPALNCGGALTDARNDVNVEDDYYDDDLVDPDTVINIPQFFDETKYFKQQQNNNIEQSDTQSATQCHDIPGWVDSDGLNCNWYAENLSSCNTWHPSTDTYIVASKACCVCEGGTQAILYDAESCQNTPDWKDSGNHTCSYYDGNADRCLKHGTKFAGTDGQTANEACCYCKENFLILDR